MKGIPSHSALKEVDKSDTDTTLPYESLTLIIQPSLGPSSEANRRGEVTNGFSEVLELILNIDSVGVSKNVLSLKLTLSVTCYFYISLLKKVQNRAELLSVS